MENAIENQTVAHEAIQALLADIASDDTVIAIQTDEDIGGVEVKEEAPLAEGSLN